MNKTINELDEKITKLRTQWELEKNSIMDEAQIKEEIEKTKAQIDIAERDADLERAAELKYGKMIELQKRLEDVQKDVKEKPKNQLLKEEVDEDDIAEIVSKWTGIEVSRLVESERDKLLRMEDFLHKRVIGQDEAVDVVSDADRKSVV